MQTRYFILVLLLIYGDLLKRFFSSQLSLFLIYFFIGIIASLFFFRIEKKPLLRSEAIFLYMSSFFLIFLYFFQSIVSVFNYNIDNFQSLSHTIYMAIPLFFTIIFLKKSNKLDLIKFANIFLILIIPPNLIAIYQSFIDPNFFIDTNYIETGGVITRNFLLGTSSFERYPSLFVSADRYAGMALFQFFFSLVLLDEKDSNPKTKKNLWIYFNILFSFAALLISGSRSKIFIVTISIALMSFAAFLKFLSHKRLKKTNFAKKFTIILILFMLIFSFFKFTKNDNENFIFPVTKMISQTIEDNNIKKRLISSIKKSQIQEDTTIFGKGLGSVGIGKPGEFGIMSTWIESGIFFGLLIIFNFLMIIFSLLIYTVKSFILFDIYNVGKGTIVLMIITLALLTGFTSAYEISSGVIFCSSLALIMRKRVK